MKIKTEIEVAVVMGGVSHNSTSCQGYLPEGTRHEDVVRVFGLPQIGGSLDSKVQAEWVGKINGLVFTIYDYKSNVAVEENTDWHIGGEQKFVADLVNIYFNAR